MCARGPAESDPPYQSSCCKKPTGPSPTSTFAPIDFTSGPSLSDPTISPASETIVLGNLGPSTTVGAASQTADDAQAREAQAGTQWIHWCVGSRRTRVHDICVKGRSDTKTGRDFLCELKRQYRKLRGLRWYLSLTDFARVKIVKVSQSRSQYLFWLTY